MMLPLVAAATRFVRVLALANLLGTSALVLLARPAPFLPEHALPRRALLVSCLLAIVAGLVELAIRSLDLADLAPTGGVASAGWALLARTRMGRAWLVEQLALCVAALHLAAPPAIVAPGRLRAAGVAVAAAVALLARPLASHTAGLDDPQLALAVRGAHLLAVGLWVGGVLALAGLAHHAARRPEAPGAPRTADLLLTFSRAAPALVAVAVVSGVALATWHVGTWPRLLATRYGAVLVAKLLLLAAALSVAGQLRLRLLPAFAEGGTAAPSRIRRHLLVEGGFAAGAVLLAAAMAETVPAAHDIVSWWLPFRFSLRATWGQPWVPERVLAGIGVAVLGLAVAIARLRLRDRRGTVAAATAGAAFAVALALPPLSVKAYPGTYWTPDVPYDAASVANGRRLFRHCTSCHGLAGRGDGPLAATLPKRPANLTEPHTADHTAGDIFWWLTHGIPESGMPGFAGALSAEERWDVVNYLRAFAAGYQARILGPRVSPGVVWLGQVDFAFTTTSGESGRLRDFRERATVLLVFFSPGASDGRLADLVRRGAALRSLGAEILAVPLGPTTGAVLPPLPVVAAEAADVVESYALFRRTFADPGNERDDDMPSHLEVLMDRFGYIRARWRPDQDGPGGGDLRLLQEQLRILAAEPRLAPPPDEHVH